MSDDSRDYASSEVADTRSAADGPADQERAPNTLLNALIGGVVGVVLSFIPFSTVLGGGVAGYLEGGDYSAGAKVGALAGLVTLIPFLFIVIAVLLVVPVTSAPGFQVALWVSLLVILAGTTVYTVGFSSLGGILGVYVHEEV